MVLAAYLTTALVVGAVGACHLLRDQHLAGPRVMFSMAMWMATLVAPIQILAGDQHGLNTLEHQPVKIMAMEGHYREPQGRRAADPVRPARPGRRQGRNTRSKFPKLGSLILKHSLDAPMAGLDTVPRENWPPVPITFWSFRIMVGIGFLMLGLGLFSLWMRWRGTLYQLAPVAHASRWRWARPASSRCSRAGSPPRPGASPSRSTDCCARLMPPRRWRRLRSAPRCIAFVIVYFVVFAAGVIYLLRLMALPPHPGEQGPDSRHAGPRRRHHAGRRRDCGGRPMTVAIDLATIWAFIIAFAVFVYVVMDGFDLGLGILFPLFPEKADRDVIMNSVAPVWDGNETWLVLGGGGLMAAFPLAYAVLMPALYTPMIAMLIGLIFRGVAFEFRWRTRSANATAGTSPSPADRCWPRWRRASRSAPSCRACTSTAGIMPAAGGTG